METVVEHENVITDDLWRAWKERSRRRDQAVARKMKFFGALVIFVFAAVFALRAFTK